MWRATLHQARRIVVLLLGVTLILFGAVLLVTPGPGWLVILAGLAVLAFEFVWAQRLLKRIKRKGQELRRTMFNSPPS
jgi:uncharacterized protein (TIGR02611 family)